MWLDHRTCVRWVDPFHDLRSGDGSGENSSDGKCSRRSNSSEGTPMPVFSFEKISPPPPVPALPASEKPRGLIVQMLDRFVEARVKRTLAQEKPGPVDRAKAAGIGRN